MGSLWVSTLRSITLAKYEYQLLSLYDHPAQHDGTLSDLMTAAISNEDDETFRAKNPAPIPRPCFACRCVRRENAWF
jgi:hypothetical protein